MRMRGLAAATAAAPLVVLGIAGCASETGSAAATTPAPSSTDPTGWAPEQLYGTWDDAGDYNTFEPDGTWYTNYKKYYDDGSWYLAGDKVDPFNRGTFTVDGSTVTITTAPVGEAMFCEHGTIGRYTVTFVDADTMKMEEVDDECQGRAQVFTQDKWERVKVVSSDG